MEPVDEACLASVPVRPAAPTATLERGNAATHGRTSSPLGVHAYSEACGRHRSNGTCIVRSRPMRREYAWSAVLPATRRTWP